MKKKKTIVKLLNSVSGDITEKSINTKIRALENVQ